MRNQRRSGLTVEIVRQRVTEDDMGDATTDPKRCTVRGCQFDPDLLSQGVRSVERADGNDQVRVLLTGVLNMPGSHRLIADDLVKFLGSTWQVVGHSQQWLTRTKVRVQQARRK